MRGGRIAAALIGLALASGGCLSGQGRLDAASFGDAEGAFIGIERRLPVVRREVVGRDTRITSVLMVPTLDGPSLERAIANALEGSGGDTLVGVQVRTTELWFLIGWSVLEVRGDVATLGAAP